LVTPFCCSTLLLLLDSDVYDAEEEQEESGGEWTDNEYSSEPFEDDTLFKLVKLRGSSFN